MHMIDLMFNIGFGPLNDPRNIMYNIEMFVWWQSFNLKKTQNQASWKALKLADQTPVRTNQTSHGLMSTHDWFRLLICNIVMDSLIN